MRNIFLKATLVLSVLSLLSCTKKNKVETPIMETAKTETTSGEIQKEEVVLKSIQGKVIEIKNGKDGYTAKIETADKKFYFVTISHANLTDANQYKSVKEGDDLKVTGDFWKMENENQITVRSID